MLVRPALGDDATAISRVVLSALHEANACDDGPEIVARVARSYTPERVAAQIAERQVFVALEGSRIVGTASRDGGDVRAVFAAPDVQGRGIGQSLMAEVERAAREAGIAALTLQSSLTASNFYLGLGFRVVRDHRHRDERTIVMERACRPRRSRVAFPKGTRYGRPPPRPPRRRWAG